MTHPTRRGRILPPQLDDRTWADLVAEMKALIPTYAPQWTDHNPSDLGITLLELFAWLGEQIIYRTNRIPEQNYLAYLNLLGITRRPATPAATYLTFRSDAAAPVAVPTRTQVQTPNSETSPAVVFETTDAIDVVPTALAAALRVDPDEGLFDDVTDNLVGLAGDPVGPPARPQTVTVPADATVRLCLGFDRTWNQQLDIGFRMRSAAPAGTTATWSYSRGREPSDWETLPVDDGTDGLHRDGTVSVTVPAGWAPQPPTAEGDPDAVPEWEEWGPNDSDAPPLTPRFWIAVDIQYEPVASADQNQPAVLVVDRVLVNTVLARTTGTVVEDEILGTSSGEPFQTFEFAHRPLFIDPARRDSFPELAVEVASDAGWEMWARSDDLAQGAGTVYRLDPVAGTVMFGNHLPNSERGREGHGSVPPAGRQIRVRGYRYVAAGADGNVAAGQVTAFRSPLPNRAAGQVTVVNRAGAFGGSDEEPVDDTLRRAPQVLKTRDRAVTQEDYEYLAREATTDVAIACCLPPRLHETDNGAFWKAGQPWKFAHFVRAPGTVYVVVVPDSAQPEPHPWPALLDEVRAYLDQRRTLTAHLQVVGPAYLPVKVEVRVSLWQQAKDAGISETAVRESITAKIEAYLHSTRGGPAGTGWELGQPVFVSDLFRAIKPPDEVAYITSLRIAAETPAYFGSPPPNPSPGGKRPFALSPLGATVRVADYELVCSATGLHSVGFDAAAS